MADEQTPQAGSETPAEQPKNTEVKAPKPAKTWDDDFDSERAKNTIEALRGDKRELKDENKALKTQLDELTKKVSSVDQLLEKVSKMETALSEAETARKQSELNAARITVAARYGLPSELAKRVQGDTPEAMDEDAKALAAALPQAKPGRFSPGNTGVSVTGQAMHEVVLERMRGRKAGPSEASEPSVHRAKGGGVVGVNIEE